MSRLGNGSTFHRNADVWNITARTVRKLVWREKKCWPCGETQNHPKNVAFFEGVLRAVLNSLFHKSQGKWNTKRNHHECKHVANAKISTRRKTERSFFKKMMKTLGQFPGRSDDFVTIEWTAWDLHIQYIPKPSIGKARQNKTNHVQIWFIS